MFNIKFIKRLDIPISVRENVEFDNVAKFGNLPHYQLLNSTTLLNS